MEYQSLDPDEVRSVQELVSTIPLPQALTVQFESHPSPLLTFPSSHCSPVSTTELAHVCAYAVTGSAYTRSATIQNQVNLAFMPIGDL